MTRQATLPDYLARFDHGTGSSPAIPAVVIGICKHGLYLARSFERQGIPVVVLADSLAEPSARTRHGHKVHCPDINGPALIETLRALAADLPAGAPIFATNDRIVDLLLGAYDELAYHYRLPFPKGDIVPELKDKARLDARARKAGLPVPLTVEINGPGDLASHAERLAYPVAVKPVLPMSSFKSRRCATPAELRDQVEASTRIGEPLLVQEWIEGGDETILFAAYYIAPDGRCKAHYSGRKLMSYPPLTGHAAATESFDLGDRLEEGLRFLRDQGYRGLCSIEYKGLPPARAKFIEVTVGRCDWWIMCCGINGVDIPMAAYCDLTGSAIPYRNRQTSDYVWHDLEHSLPVLADNILKGRWGPGRVLRFLLRRKKDALFSLSDPMPFLYSLPRYIRQVTDKVARRIKRGAGQP